MATAKRISLDSRDGLHRDILRRDGLLPLSGSERGAAGRIAVALLAVFGLALLGSLPAAKEKDGQRIERLALPGSVPPPQIVMNSGSPVGNRGN